MERELLVTVATLVLLQPAATLAIQEHPVIADIVDRVDLLVRLGPPVTLVILVLRQHPGTADILVAVATADIPGRAVTLASQELALPVTAATLALLPLQAIADTQVSVAIRGIAATRVYLDIVVTRVLQEILAEQEHPVTADTLGRHQQVVTLGIAAHLVTPDILELVATVATQGSLAIQDIAGHPDIAVIQVHQDTLDIPGHLGTVDIRVYPDTLGTVAYLVTADTLDRAVTPVTAVTLVWVLPVIAVTLALHRLVAILDILVSAVTVDIRG